MPIPHCGYIECGGRRYFKSTRDVHTTPRQQQHIQVSVANLTGVKIQELNFASVYEDNSLT